MTDIAHAGLAASLLGLMGLADVARAQPSPLNARVVWVRDERVFIASLDSVALEPGGLLTFVSRGKRVATGEVLRVYADELAVAKLTSGSLETVKKLDRVRVLAERPPLRAPPALRVGYPAGSRANPMFACEHVTLRPPPSPGFYRTDTLTERSYRLVRLSEAVARPPWPDTIRIRLFDEVADQEIALERGELDVAVFWPGELSSHLREQPRWQPLRFGTRARGVLAAIRLGPEALADSSAIAFPDRLAFASLNRELFRGDLAPWGEPAGWPAGPESPSSSRPGAARFEVDPSCPGWQALERFLNQGRRSQAGPDGARRVRVFRLDAPVHAPDSLSLGVADYIRSGDFSPELRARADTLAAEIRRLAAAREPVPGRLRNYLRDSLRVTFLFAMACPLVAAPELRPYVDALGTDALVDLLDCRPPNAKP